MKKENKKIILSIITFILFIIVFFLSFLLFQKYVIKTNFENKVLDFKKKNYKDIFNINEITFFSSADAKNKNALKSNFTIENLYQYTDIAFYINSPQKEKTLENTLKSVSIENINFSQLPSLGSPKLYYKNLNNFAQSTINESNIIHDKLEFQTTAENEINLDTPTLYNNLANPIVISYVNENIRPDYTITNTKDPITYDGSLLKKCNIPLSSINCNFSFDLFITNNLNQKFKANVQIAIPLEDNEKIIYNGNLILKQNTNFNFYRYE